MAVRIKREFLSEDDIETVQRRLTFHNPRQHSSQVKFYIEGEDYLLVPYLAPHIDPYKSLSYCGNWLSDFIEKEPDHYQIEFSLSTELRDEQVSVMEEAMTQLEKQGTTLLNLPTAYGKTSTSIYLMAHLGYQTIIHCNITTISTQWLKDILTSTDVAREEIAVLNNTTKDAVTEITKVVVVLPGSIRRIPDWYTETTGLVIIDEVHCYLNPTGMRAVLACCPRYVIGCTATPKRSSGIERMLPCFFGDQFVKRGLLRPYNVVAIQTGLSVPMRNTTNGLTRHQSMVEALYNLEVRNALIINFIINCKVRPLIILTKNIFHLHILESLLDERGIEYSSFYDRMKTYVRKDILIGTYDKISLGFDEKNFCEDYNGVASKAVLMTIVVGNETNMVQSIGRSSRSSEIPIVYQLVDNCNSESWKDNVKWYKHNGCKISAIDYRPWVRGWQEKHGAR